MTGYNLPPGCNVSDIPGNRPGDDERVEVVPVRIGPPRRGRTFYDCYVDDVCIGRYPTQKDAWRAGAAHLEHEAERDRAFDEALAWEFDLHPDT